MNWSDVTFLPSPRTLRQFAILWMLFVAGLAAWQGSLANRASPAFLLAALAICLGLAGLAKPALIRPIFVAWMILFPPILAWESSMDEIRPSALDKIATEQSGHSILGEFWDLVRHRKKWWLLPILTMLLLMGALLLLSTSAAAPFIYTLF